MCFTNPVRRLIGLLILAGLLVGLDYGVKFVAENVAARALRHELEISSSPDVDVDAFPFVVAAIRGEYREITVEAPNVERGSVRLDDVRFKLSDVDLPLSDLISGEPRMHAARVRGTATISESTLNSLVQNVSPSIGVEVDRDGVTVSAAGIEVTTPASIEIGGGHLNIAASGIQSIDIPVPNILPKVEFADVVAEKNRLVVTFAGRDIDFDRLR